jgi:hypothetical protein
MVGGFSQWGVGHIQMKEPYDWKGEGEQWIGPVPVCVITISTT